jgi:hypothetical protein
MTQTDPTAQQIQQYERDGFLIVERWLSDDEVERLFPNGRFGERPNDISDNAQPGFWDRF